MTQPVFDMPTPAEPNWALPLPLDDLPTCARLIAEVSGKPLEEVCRRLRQEHRCLGSNVRDAMQTHAVPRYVQSAALQELYADTDSFLYETLVWNRCPTKQAMRNRIIKTLQDMGIKAARILVFGDGLGFDCTALALAGHAVTYYEIGSHSLGFARHVFALNRVHVQVCLSVDHLPRESFDAIVCLDVLEHIADPPGMVHALSQHLRSGGVFFSHAPFAYLHPCVGTHLRSNARYSGDWRQLYGANGFVPVDGAFFWNPIVLQKSGLQPLHRFPFRRSIAWSVGGWLLALSRFWPGPYTVLCRLIAAGQSAHLTCDGLDNLSPDNSFAPVE